jgi:1,4-dihydroxy-6-naphthoate synthase
MPYATAQTAPAGAPDDPRPVLRLGHSPDPDDAFMWWPLADFTTPDGKTHAPRIHTAGYRFHHVLEDIQSLNVRSEKGELEITALSIHQYPFVAEHYALTTCGSSMGDGYGPMIVTKPGRFTSLRDLRGAKLAIPGLRTTAWLSCQLALAEHGLCRDDVQWEPVMFDQIPAAVLSGDYDAGLIIHEGQITFAQQGLALLIDLGAWWKQTRGLPLPLGGNAIRRDLVDAGAGPTICRVLLDSIEFALAHRDEAVAFSLNYARDLDPSLASRFVGMYVNDWTLDYGDLGRRAVQRLLDDGAAAGLTPRVGDLTMVSPAGARTDHR